MTHETTWRIVAVAAVSLALVTFAALAIVLVIAFATLSEAVQRAVAGASAPAAVVTPSAGSGAV